MGNLFQRSITEEAVLAVMGIQERKDLSETMISALGMRGEVMMFHHSPDILVLVGTRTRSAPDIYARCS